MAYTSDKIESRNVQAKIDYFVGLGYPIAAIGKAAQVKPCRVASLSKKVWVDADFANKILSLSEEDVFDAAGLIPIRHARNIIDKYYLAGIPMSSIAEAANLHSTSIEHLIRFKSHNVSKVKTIRKETYESIVKAIPKLDELLVLKKQELLNMGADDRHEYECRMAERAVQMLIRRGYSTSEIAQKLGLSTSFVQMTKDFLTI